MKRSTRGEEALSRGGVLGLGLVRKERGLILSFCLVQIEEVVGGCEKQRAGKSDS